MNETTGIVHGQKVDLPKEVNLPDGTKVRVLWDQESVKPVPLEREPLTEEDVRADIEWATGKRFPG
jgi:hypothetical protein